jgi:hypothetical protein
MAGMVCFLLSLHSNAHILISKIATEIFKLFIFQISQILKMAPA